MAAHETPNMPAFHSAFLTRARAEAVPDPSTVTDLLLPASRKRRNPGSRGTLAVPSATLSSLPLTANMPVIPPNDPNDRGRTLILCFDGTGDQFDNDNSNIVGLFSLLLKGVRGSWAGIGTYTTGQVASPFWSKWSKLVDQAIASSLDSHVMDGYEFLMQNYTAGDKISIFGFSRGAYTARSLAGMIHKVGLLPACNHRQVPFAYKMYITTDEMGWKQSNAFKKASFSQLSLHTVSLRARFGQAFSIDVSIDFIGVFDTVNSVGFIPKRLPFTTSNTIVRTFRHAVSLDERRAKFKPNLWNRPDAVERLLGAAEAGARRVIEDVEEVADRVFGKVDEHIHGSEHGHPKGELRANKHEGEHGHEHDKGKHKESEHDKHRKAQMNLERKYSGDAVVETDIEEVWFAGCHCDVGGGSVENDTPSSLARIPLRWMVRECFKTNTGIVFITSGLREIGLDPDALYPIVQPRPAALPVGDARIRPMPAPGPPKVGTGEADTANSLTLPSSSILSLPVASTSKSEEEHDLLDALAPIYDQLALSWSWWALELLPMRHRFQRADDAWESYLGLNLGGGRVIPRQKTSGVKVHRSVKTRIEAAEKWAEDLAKARVGKGKGKKSTGHGHYKPRAMFDLEHTIWVD
ncbi:DUF2235 domain-containing protein [Mycena kentingensis (nom. inval.)]|nr:DUF2235 domain-containing protein [Mycena kentingensis (nom. inval.)]